MEHPNLGICNECREAVPAEFLFRDGQVWIRKDCADCGPNESLVSTKAEAWQAKRDLWDYIPDRPVSCRMRCENCEIDHDPNMVFLDVTNRCNMNCPICIATIRGMGFDFNPPLEYFEKIFAHLGSMKRKPVVQLFGGEPTVRKDLLEIIAIGKKHGLKPHVVTNGVKLADEDYCRELCEARVPMRFAFDGRNADIYERLRHNRAAYDKKMKGLENLKKYSRRKHAIIACAAWGFNDQYMPDMFQFFHDNRDLISDVGIIPLTENWEPGVFEIERPTTMEDVEQMVAQCFPEGDVEFIPAGLSYSMLQIRSFFRTNPRSEVLLLAGVHPNCESITLLVSDGKRYRGVNHYLKKPLSQVAVEFAARARKIEPKLDRLDPKKFFQRQRGRMLVFRTFAFWVLGSVRFGRIFGYNPLGALFKVLFRKVFPKKSEHGFKSRRPRRVLRVAMLPFEEQHSIDAARLESCKAVFAYENVDDDKVKFFAACNWYPYRNALLEKISQKYGTADGRYEVDKPAPVEEEATA